MTSSKEDPETLASEILVAQRLGQHGRVSKLCNRLAQLLVEKFDQDLEELEEEEEENEQLEWSVLESHEWALTNAVCNRLRAISRLSSIYGDVLEFVRVQDLVAFGQLVGASRRKLQLARRTLDWPNYELLERTMRQSAILLRELNDSKRALAYSSVSSKMRPLLRDSLTKIVSNELAFERHSLASSLDEDSQSAAKQEEQLLANWLAEKSSGQQREDKLIGLMNEYRSSWFAKFTQCLLLEPYHLDRFSIFVSLWIIGVQCGHAQLEQLMCELCDQIFHQETNSCQLEELMQLTQAGSFWVTHRKRFQASLKRGSFSPSLGLLLDEENLNELVSDEEEEEEEEEEDEEDQSEESKDREEVHELGGESVGRSVSLLAWLTSGDDGAKRASNLGDKFGPIGEMKRLDLALRLRRQIERELLLGDQCVLCGREPSGQLLEPVQWGHCVECGLELWGAIYCSCSFRSFPLVSMHNLASISAASRLEIVSPGEWALRALEAVDQIAVSGGSESAKLGARPKTSGDRASEETEITGERIELTDKFERLTVIRNSSHSSTDDEDQDQDGSSAATKSNDDSPPPPGGSPTGSTDETSEASLGEQELDNFEGGTLGAKVISGRRPGGLLRQFMQQKARLAAGAKQPSSGCDWRPNPAASETLQMVDFVRCSMSSGRQVGGKPSERVLCVLASDLMICSDSIDRHHLQLSIHTSRRLGVLSTDHQQQSAARRRQVNKMTSSDLLIDYDLLYACLSRSSSSQLLLGCGRFYSQVEILRTTGQGVEMLRLFDKQSHLANCLPEGPASSDIKCPHCHCHLVELRVGLGNLVS